MRQHPNRARDDPIGNMLRNDRLAPTCAQSRTAKEDPSREKARSESDEPSSKNSRTETWKN